MKRTVLMTTLAMSLSLGASWADKPSGTFRTENHHRLTQATNDAAGQQVPVQSDESGKAEREKQPVLVAPCPNCRQYDFISPWQQFQLVLSRIYWI
jgi:hypothetical protein